MAYMSSPHTPYNYGFNDPVYYNDPYGDYPEEVYNDWKENNRKGGGGMAPDPFGYETNVAKSNPYRIGPGSAHDWMAGYRSVEMNFALMSRNQFGAHYGINPNDTWSLANALSQSPSQNDLNSVNAEFDTSFELNGNGQAGYWDMSGIYGGAQATWVPLSGSSQDVVTQQDLINFVSKNPMYKQYPAEWILDSEGKRVSPSKPGKAVATFKRNKDGSLYVSHVRVYIHPSAFGTITDYKQTLVTGHEFIHVMHYLQGSILKWQKQFGWDGAEAISEYYAYQWQVDKENSLGYPIGGQVGFDKYSKLLPLGLVPR